MSLCDGRALFANDKELARGAAGTKKQTKKPAYIVSRSFLFKGLLFNSVHFFSQFRFFAGCGIFGNNAVLSRFIQQAGSIL